MVGRLSPRGGAWFACRVVLVQYYFNIKVYIHYSKAQTRGTVRSRAITKRGSTAKLLGSARLSEFLFTNYIYTDCE